MVFDFALWIRIDTLRAGPNYQTPFSGINIDLSNPSAEDCKSLRKFQKFQKRFILWRMDSSTSKTSFFANWIKLFLILEKKSTSAQYVTKFVQCRYSLKNNLEIFRASPILLHGARAIAML